MLLATEYGASKVYMPSYTFSSTANAFLRAGFDLTFVDINPSPMAAGLAEFEAADPPPGSVIMPVHYVGDLGETDLLATWAADRGVLLAEDAAEAPGSRLGVTEAGTFGALRAISFHYTKECACLTGEERCISTTPRSSRTPPMCGSGAPTARPSYGVRWTSTRGWRSDRPSREPNSRPLSCWQVSRSSTRSPRLAAWCGMCIPVVSPDWRSAALYAPPLPVRGRQLTTDTSCALSRLPRPRHSGWICPRRASTCTRTTCHSTIRRWVSASV